MQIACKPVHMMHFILTPIHIRQQSVTIACAHRSDGGYEPNSVIVCPVEAIISGDMDDENSKISGLLANEKNVMARKPEKMTQPNLYYINGTNEMLDPNQTKADCKYVWSEQSKGVGHYAKYADKRVNESDTENLLIQLAMENSARSGKPIDQRSIDKVAKEIQQDLDENKVECMILQVRVCSGVGRSLPMYGPKQLQREHS